MKNSFKLVVQILFALVTFIFSVAISMGIDFELEKLSDISFWVIVLARWAITMVLYNVIFAIDNDNRRRDEKSYYYKIMAVFRYMVNLIYAEKRVEDCIAAVEEKNRERLTEKQNNMLHKISSRISLEDIGGGYDRASIDEKLKRYGLSGIRKRKMHRAIKKIVSGQIKIKKLNINKLLYDKTEEKYQDSYLDFNYSTFIIRQNLIKTVTFLIFTVAMVVIKPGAEWNDVFYTVISNITLLIGPAVSAIMSSSKYIKLRYKTFEERNRFFQEKLGIAPPDKLNTYIED